MAHDQNQPIPYARQSIHPDDIDAVVAVLKSDWLTTGPAVEKFEEQLARSCGSAHAVAVSNGTAALHLAMLSLDLSPGDQVIVPAMTFVATANAVRYVGACPVFADVDQATLLIDPQSVARCITSKTRAVIAVDYAGQPCDYDQLQSLCDQHGLTLVADACHSIGARYQARPVGSLATMSCFSFHPVKPITCGEGGAITTDDPILATRLKRLRSHGIDLDHHQRQARGQWSYQMVELGYNYRITDL